MRIFYMTLLALLCSKIGTTQLVISGTSTATSVANNAPSIFVDQTLTISGTGTITSTLVSVATNFSSGDVLSYTGALPSGVSGTYNATTGVLTFSGSASLSDYQTLLRTVKFNTTSSSASQRTINFNLGSAIAFSSNGHFYEYISGSFTWSAAKADADSKTFYGLQGYLATITSAAENDFILQKIGADAWIGASDDYLHINSATGASTYADQNAAEGKWYWVTGPVGEIGMQFSNGNTNPTAVGGNYMNWNTNEPNNAGSEHYAQIFASNSVGKWNDLGGQSLAYVIEYGGMAGDPSVTLTHSRPITMIATSLTTSPANSVYSMNDAATFVDQNITVYSNGSITDARVTISNGFVSGDVLSYSGALPGGVSSSYNATTGVLSFTGSATATQWQALFRTVKFNSSSNTLGNRAITFSAGNLVAFSNGHFYEYISGTTSWTSALSNAAARTYMNLNGYLATITSQAENDFVKDKLNADAWIGASDDYTYINAATGTSTYANQGAAEGKWYWVSGPVGEKGVQFSNGNINPVATNSMFNNWNPAEPNNSGNNEHYGELYSSGANPGKWNDLPNNNLGYVVEYGGLAADPLLELSSTKTLVVSSFLAVSGLELNATKVGNGVQLKWSTRSEKNSDRFEVLFSTDGSNFNSIRSVPATGSINSGGVYEFLHSTPNQGMNYYRIRETDIFGKQTLSSVRTVNFAKAQLKLAPNPAKDQLKVSLPYSGVPATIIIRNNSGAIVYKQTVSVAETIISVSQFSAGVYQLEVNENGNKLASKFIKL